METHESQKEDDKFSCENTIEELIRYQKELEEQNNISEYLFRNIPGGYHRCAEDEGYSFLHVSERFLEILGWTEEEIRTKFENKFINLVHPDDKHLLFEYYRYWSWNEQRVFKSYF